MTQMKARCGQENCDCGHTIEKLVKALEQIRMVAETEPTIDRTLITIQRAARAAIKLAKGN
jgi:hypothetical protein